MSSIRAQLHGTCEVNGVPSTLSTQSQLRLELERAEPHPHITSWPTLLEQVCVQTLLHVENITTNLLERVPSGRELLCPSLRLRCTKLETWPRSGRRFNTDLRTEIHCVKDRTIKIEIVCQPSAIHVHAKC